MGTGARMVGNRGSGGPRPMPLARLITSLMFGLALELARPLPSCAADHTHAGAVIRFGAGGDVTHSDSLTHTPSGPSAEAVF
jgi:hypothetical protein